MHDGHQGGGSRASLTYFYDFVELIKRDYPPTSLFAIAEEIAFAREVGPALAGLKRTNGIFEMTVPIGYGHFAIIELEFDAKARLQPVMGGISKD